jgi:hypothetical protein
MSFFHHRNFIFHLGKLLFISTIHYYYSFSLFISKTFRIVVNTRWRRQEEKSDAVISPPIKFSDCLDLDLTPSCVIPFQAVTKITLDALFLTSSRFFWAVIHFALDAIKEFLLDAVIYSSQQGKLRLCHFLHFYAPKTSKMPSFPEFTPKLPKITKGTI